MKAYWTLVAVFGFIVVLSFVMNLYFITSGVFLGLLMLFSVCFGYVFLPNWIKKIIVWGPIGWIIDFALSWGLTYGLGFSVTGFTAGIVFGLLVSMAIEFEKHRFKQQRAR